ncbi:MAG: hypothetical protein HOJ35_04940 [Bdellovibrionales bacterium]|jgi:hypothetical protein|nr:hypothetical protein [Bdellovibrionales bacterium]
MIEAKNEYSKDGYNKIINQLIEVTNILPLYIKQADLNICNGSMYLVKIVDTIELFIQGINNTNKFIKINLQDNERYKQDLYNIKIHLLSIMKGIESAKNNNDYIMLNDLLEYELADNLTQWKLKILPRLKKIVHK